MKYPYIKFYFRDWQANIELQTCSITARGVWIEMMCIMAQSERFGYLERSGKAMDVENISRLIRVDIPTLNPAIAELERAGVFSRCDKTGAIYSRRMVKDNETAGKFAEFGKRGGNPSLKNLSKRIPIPIAIPIPTEGLTLGDNPTLNPKKQVKKFVKPTVDLCKEYASKIDMTASDAVHFFDYQESKGWIVGRSAMKDWQAAMRTWKKNAFTAAPALRNNFRRVDEPAPASDPIGDARREQEQRKRSIEVDRNLLTPAAFAEKWGAI